MLRFLDSHAHARNIHDHVLVCEVKRSTLHLVLLQGVNSGRPVTQLFEMLRLRYLDVDNRGLTLIYLNLRLILDTAVLVFNLGVAQDIEARE